MPDLLAHDRRAGRPLAGDEGEVAALGVDVLDEHVERAVDDLVEGRVVAAYGAHHRPQRHEGLLDQRQPEVVERVEVAVEGGRHDADGAGDLAQRERGQGLLVGELERGVEDGAAGLLLALAAGLGHAPHANDAHVCTDTAWNA